MKHQILLVLATFTMAILVPIQAADLTEQVQELTEKHQDVVRRASKLASEGKVDEANREIVKLTENDTSTAMALWAGNLLYSADSVASYKLHQRAYEKEPKEKMTILEWAMERHRKGEWKEAAELYQKYFVLEPEDEAKHALLADCLIRTGKLKEAVAAWKAANHPDNHTGIDFVIYEIHGELSPVRRRGDLLKKIRAGETNLFERLILLDLHFDNDWWNQSVNERALQFDLDLATKTLGEKNTRREDLAAAAEILSKEERSRNEIEEALTKAGLMVGEKGRLPQSSLLARALCETIISRHVESPTALWKRFQAELVRRAEGKEGDLDALQLLCFLAVDGDKSQLEKWDRYGWERYQDANCAASFLVGQARDKKLSLDSPDLKKALKAFPDRSEFTSLQMHLAGEDGISEAMLVAAIQAEYQKLSEGMVIRDSYTLKGLFRRLAERVK